MRKLILFVLLFAAAPAATAAGACWTGSQKGRVLSTLSFCSSDTCYHVWICRAAGSSGGGRYDDRRRHSCSPGLRRWRPYRCRPLFVRIPTLRAIQSSDEWVNDHNVVRRWGDGLYSHDCRLHRPLWRGRELGCAGMATGTVAPENSEGLPV